MPYATVPNTTGPRKPLNLLRLQDMRGNERSKEDQRIKGALLDFFIAPLQ